MVGRSLISRPEDLKGLRKMALSNDGAKGDVIKTCRCPEKQRYV